MTALRLVAGAREEGARPAWDEQAEVAVIAAILAEGDMISHVEDFLRPDHFHAETHRRVFAAMMGLRASKRSIDVVTVGREAELRHGLATAREDVARLTWAAPALIPRQLREAGEIVHGCWRRRTLADHGRLAAARASLQDDPDEIAAELARGAQAVADARPGLIDEAETHAQGLRRLGEGMAGRAPRRAGLTTGVKAWDEWTGGLLPGEKTTVVAPTGGGKSHVATHVSCAAARAGVPVLIFSAGEMTADELLCRRLANECGVDSRRIRLAMGGGAIAPSEVERLIASSVATAHWPVYVVDDRSSVEELASRARRFREKFGVGLVIVDYVQKLRASKGTERFERRDQVAHATTALKDLAQELDIPVLELAQQTGEDGRERKAPEKGKAGAESRWIDKTADVVIALHPFDAKDRENVTCLVLKSRHGEEGEFLVRLDLARSRMISNG